MSLPRIRAGNQARGPVKRKINSTWQPSAEGVSWWSANVVTPGVREVQVNEVFSVSAVTVQTVAGRRGWRTRNLSSVADDAVDAFAEQVGVAVVAGVLLDHVLVDPAQ